MAHNDNIDDDFEDYDPDIMTLSDEEGNEFDFEVIDAADFNDKRYLAMVPYVKEPEKVLEEDAYLIIMRVDEENGEEILSIVDDDDELMGVNGMFANRLEELFDIDPSMIN